MVYKNSPVFNLWNYMLIPNTKTLLSAEVTCCNFTSGSRQPLHMVVDLCLVQTFIFLFLGSYTWVSPIPLMYDCNRKVRQNFHLTNKVCYKAEAKSFAWLSQTVALLIMIKMWQLKSGENNPHFVGSQVNSHQIYHSHWSNCKCNGPLVCLDMQMFRILIMN